MQLDSQLCRFLIDDLAHCGELSFVNGVDAIQERERSDHSLAACDCVGCLKLRSYLTHLQNVGDELLIQSMNLGLIVTRNSKSAFCSDDQSAAASTSCIRFINLSDAAFARAFA